MTTKGKRGLKIKWDWCIPFFFMLGILFLTTCLQAAEKDSVKFVAKGIVVNKNKQPLYGACVMVKNSNERIYTGVDGKFSLAVKKGTKLVVSLLGKMDKEIRAKVDKEMQVVLIDEEYIEERMPRFVGEGVEMYIVRNIKYPKDALEMKIQGKVYVQFIIEKDGSVSEIKVLRPVCHSLDYEACRIIREMPRWRPGIQKGKPVRVSYTIPINFMLQ